MRRRRVMEIFKFSNLQIFKLIPPFLQPVFFCLAHLFFSARILVVIPHQVECPVDHYAVQLINKRCFEFFCVRRNPFRGNKNVGIHLSFFNTVIESDDVSEVMMVEVFLV